MEILQASPLLIPSHREEWEKSAVCPTVYEKNVWTITDGREVDQLLNRNAKSRWKHSDGLVPGWAVTGLNPKTGERTFKGAQFKPDVPPTDRNGKTFKYLSPSQSTLSPLFLETSDPEFWQRLLFEFTTPIVITEGAKKAASMLSLGIPAISLPGVATGGKLGRLRPELELFCRYGRPIYLAFDRDIVQKPQVRQALHNLGRMLAAKGCMVFVLEWANQWKGIDEYLASRGGNVVARANLVSMIDQANTLEEWRESQEDKAELTAGETCRLALRYEMVSDKLRGRVRWNGLKGCPELDGQEADIDELRLYLAIRHNIDIPAEDCASIIMYLAKQSSFSPVMEYLKQCSELYEPDDDLLNSVAAKYLGATSELHRMFIRKTLIAAVARAFQPGCKVDTVCILSGKQGAGKSAFWNVLAGDWFDDSVGSVSDKDERLKLHQSWFVEWAELESVFKRKDISAIKAFITTQTDSIRPPYGRTVKEFPRPSIIVGSTNHDEFLADPTGNRRFWVVPTPNEFIPVEELSQERDRIWAAATHAFLKGEAWTLPKEYRELQVEANQAYQISDPWEDPVLDFCEGKDRVQVAHILSEALHLDIDRHDKSSQMRVANLLKANGWTTSRVVVQGRRQRFWFSPSFIEIGCPGCPEEEKNGSAVEGQPLGQPLGQPPGQPPDSEKVEAQKNGRDNLDSLDSQIPKSSRSEDSTLCKPFEVGETVYVIDGQFWGKPVVIEALNGATARVRAESWIISREYFYDRLARELPVAGGVK